MTISVQSPYLAPALQRRARVLLFCAAVLVILCTALVLYARGYFDASQRLILVAEDSEGVVPGMDLTFSGFPIGRVRSIALAPDAKVHIHVDVAQKDAHWLRSSSVFTLVKGVMGNSTIRAYSGVAQDPPLPEGAMRPVLQGDVGAELPRLASAAREVLENLGHLTREDGSLAAALDQLQSLARRSNGPGGVVETLLGTPEKAARVVDTVAQTQALLRQFQKLTAHADTQVFGQRGLVAQSQESLRALLDVLVAARTSLQQVDAILQEAHGLTRNAHRASVDLEPLRDQIQANLREIELLVADIHRRWPFSRKLELQLP